MNMYVNNQPYNRQFLEAADASAVSPEHVQLIKDTIETLKTDFEDHFGPSALLNYYQGIIKVQKYDEDDRASQKGNKPWLLSKKFNPHFAHEDLADDLGIGFGSLHIPILHPYFMAISLFKKTGNPIYANIAEDIFENLQEAALQNVLEGRDTPNVDDLQIISVEISIAAEAMIEHTVPWINGKRLADPEAD